MKHILNARILALTAFFLLGTMPVMAIERPFALNGRGVSAFITDEAGIPIGANVTSSGTATHVGVWTSVGTVSFSPDPDNPGRMLSSGIATFTAADGDTINFEFNGALEASPGSTTATDKGVFRFTGGTGRFVGASGTAEGVVVVNLLTGAFEITMVGTIDF